jgi:hypothetical protein
MLQALQTPAFRSIALAGVLFGAGAVHARLAHHTVTHRLVLHAIAEPNAFYLSAFRDGRADVRVTVEAGELHPITFEVRASVYDGCRWLGTETLEPIDSHRYAYDYSETILDCDPGATPLRKTPRKGIVTVEP